MNKKSFRKFKNKYRLFIYLILIICSAFYLRTFNIDWDNGYYFHPDERAIIMYATPLRLPANLEEFLSTESPLNPHFFAYGNFPLYLVKGMGYIFSFLDSSFMTYGGMHIVGRVISAVADTATVFLVFILGSILFSKRLGIFASLLYALSVFPIQTSHFFAVDTMLTLFMTATVLFLILFMKSPKPANALLAGLFFGLSLATKISSLILTPYLFSAFLLAFAFKQKNQKNSSIIICFFLCIISTISIYFLTQPYVLIDFSNFIQQTSLQSKMGSDPFIFPYTLQYVGKLPYIYELKNIVLFGQGPLLSFICICGLFLALRGTIKSWKQHIPFLFFTSYFIGYFMIFGNFAVGWMRYMLPLYPALALFGGYFLITIVEKLPYQITQPYATRKILLLVLIVALMLYPTSFLSIYLHANTRIQASDWINENIPPGSTIAVEHWDDALPVYGASGYNQLSLPLYDPDTTDKWNQINTLLTASDYLIVASNRLYVPLQKLTDCERLPPGKCYPVTASYYQQLFAGKRGFVKVAEFEEYPTIPFLNIPINDQEADESFTVYDHPKVMIFKNEIP